MTQRKSTSRKARVAVRLTREEQRQVDEASKTKGWTSMTFARSFWIRFGHVRVPVQTSLTRNSWIGGAQYGTHWFYERARGQYINEQAGLSVAQKKQFLLLNPKDQVITKTDLAKFENAWRFLPHLVCNGSQHSFIAFKLLRSG
jgi:hypothetical protein